VNSVSDKVVMHSLTYPSVQKMVRGECRTSSTTWKFGRNRHSGALQIGLLLLLFRLYRNQYLEWPWTA